MYVLSNGKLAEDQLILQFKAAWKLYEICNFDDKTFVEEVLKLGTSLETAEKLVEILIQGRDLI